MATFKHPLPGGNGVSATKADLDNVVPLERQAPATNEYDGTEFCNRGPLLLAGKIRACRKNSHLSYRRPAPFEAAPCPPQRTTTNPTQNPPAGRAASPNGWNSAARALAKRAVGSAAMIC